MKSMMMPSLEGEGDICASVLHAAAHSGSKEVFEGVLAAMERRLTPDEVMRLPSSATLVFGNTTAKFPTG